MLFKRHVTASFLGTASFALTAMANAATVMDFSNNPGVTGPIQLQAYSFERSAPPVALQCRGRKGGGSFTVMKPVDETSPQLAKASETRRASALEIDDMRADGTHVAYKFANAVISKIEPAKGDGPPMESVSFTYRKVQWEVDGCKTTTPMRRDFYRCKVLQAFACPWRDTRRTDLPSF